MMNPLILDTLYCMPAVTVLAGAAALRYRSLGVVRAQDNAGLRERLLRSQAALAARDDELRHLAEIRLPAVTSAPWTVTGTGPANSGLLRPELSGTPFGQYTQSVLANVESLRHSAADHAEGVARAAVQAVTRSFQSLVYSQQRAISELLTTQHEPAVLRYSIPVDHFASQLARRAQVVNLLTGTWPGRQRADTLVLDVVRGAVSRIHDYPRIDVAGDRAEYLTGRAVEPVVAAIAELLDNAARYSPPASRVDVGFVEAHHGISIVIDDAGCGLPDEERARAAGLLVNRDPIRLTEMPAPHRYGFAAVGLLAAQYGFRVSVDHQSVHQGVRAVLHIPRELLVPAPPMLRRPPEPAVGEVSGDSDSAGPRRASPYGTTSDGLAVRQRGRHRPARSAPAAPAAPASVPPTGDTGAPLSAFVSGSRAGHSAYQQQEKTP